ncbi:MAG: CAP domain-containing protein, partial [Spirochaetota bacterium]|nr:CAP domain-containing protein [Spirochaetota bacterium]
MKIMGFIISIILFIYPSLNYSLTNESILSSDEIRLFYLMNAMRKDRKIKPLKFSIKLFIKAREHSKKMAMSGVLKDKGLEDNSENSKDESGIIRIRAVLSSGANFVEESVEKIKSNYNHYRAVINSEFLSSAIAIVRSEATGNWYMSQLFLKEEEKDDSFYLEEIEFERLLQLIKIRDFDKTPSIEKIINLLGIKDFVKPDDEKITFGLNRKSVLERLDEFIHDPKTRYKTIISADSILIHLKDMHAPFSYIQLTFSNINDIFTGLHTISYYFKEKSYLKEKEILEKKYGKDNLIPEKYVNSPYYYKIPTNEKLKFSYWITEDYIIAFRWLGEEGFYVTITKTIFSLRYINFFKRDFNIQYPLSMRAYIRLLQEFLKRSPHFEPIEFIKNCKISFHAAKKERKTEMQIGDDKIEILYY